MSRRPAAPELEIVPLVPDRFDDFAALCRQMGPNRSCWCMWWREEPGGRPEGTRKERARAVVGSGPPPGLLAYADGTPVGWVAVAPRSAYPRLEKGRDTRPVDELDGVWVVPCFFVVDEHRGRGVTGALLEAAVALAAQHGAVAVEGVPVDPAVKRRTASASYTGALPLFAAAGFEEVARRTPKGKVVVRRPV